MTLTRSKHKFSVSEYEDMIKFGILAKQDRVELIRGEIVDKMTIGDNHAACVNRLTRLFSRTVADHAIVSIQNPIRLADSRPEPDVALLKPRDDYYASSGPRAEDVRLIVEVADTSLEYDREVKGALYAEAGIPEYWIVHLEGKSLLVFRQPQPDGSYQHRQTLTRGETIDVVSLPGISISIQDLF